VHSRRRGSWARRLPSTSERAIQIGSWCDTISASCPSAASIAARMANRIRAAISTYGSPQLGVSGLRK
jgi:hypothetical protein